MPVNTELLSALLAPIAGDAPAGRDMRYDPKYDAFKEERREDLAIPGVDEPGRKIADWKKVVALGSELLTNETKDLQLAAWMTEALLRQQGIDGLQTGLALVDGILMQFWEGCFPEIEDGDLELRAGPLEWIGSKLTLGVQQIPVASGGISYLDAVNARTIPSEASITAADFDAQEELRAQRDEAARFGKRMPEAVDQGIEATGKSFYKTLIAGIDGSASALATLEKSSDEKFGRDAPGFSPLRKVLEELRRFASATLAQKLESDPDPIDMSDVSEESVPSESVSADGPQTPEPASKQDAAQRLAVVARWYRQQDPTNPAPYAMLRGFRWGELRAQAPELDPRLLEAPATALRARLKGLLLDGRWSELLEQSEGLMATAPGRGWLDLQRYVLTACTNLGGSYDGVAAVVRSELRALLAAVPTLPRMTLMDDTPTANDETREWLDDEGMAPEETEAASTDGEYSEEADAYLTDGAEVMSEALEDDQATAWQGGLTRVVRRPATPRGRDAFELACGELAQQRPHRAIELLTIEMTRDRSPRGRFVRQTQIAYIMVEAGLDTVAQPILQKLIETIDEKQLEQWEAGPLVAQPIALLCRILDRNGDDGTRNDLYLRLCRLDPLQALALQAR